MLQIEICMGSACFTKGADKVVKQLKELIAEKGWEDKINLKGSFCMGFCHEKSGLGIRIDGELIEGVTMMNALPLIGQEIETRLAGE